MHICFSDGQGALGVSVFFLNLVSFLNVFVVCSFFLFVGIFLILGPA